MQGRFLPSGKFATVRPIKVVDMSLAFDTNVGFTALSVLASRCALIDDQAFSVKHFLDMDQSEAAPIFFMLNRQLVEIHKSVGSPT